MSRMLLKGKQGSLVQSSDIVWLCTLSSVVTESRPQQSTSAAAHKLPHTSMHAGKMWCNSQPLSSPVHCQSLRHMT